VKNLKSISILLSLYTLPLLAYTQGVTEVITTYNNYWKSSASSINATRPDSSHTLLAFSYGGLRYSTGVNDVALSSHGDSFIPGDFRALPLLGMSGVINGNTKIGLGALYDGVFNGAPSAVPVNNIPMYMNDGIKGLDIGTGVANLPSGDLSFNVSNLQLSSIGDGKPDILVTQIADPSGSADQYEFTDVNGNRVGNLVAITFSSINAVGNWTADFYQANSNPMILQTPFTQTDRPLRLFAADFSAFGITAANYTSISRFMIHLNGNSDIAFVAYNYATAILLPVQLSLFESVVEGKDVRLSWQTTSEVNSRDFIVETSTDGRVFVALDTIAAAGNSSDTRNYAYLHRSPGPGHHFYRLKQTDLDGKFVYSPIRRETLVSKVTAGLFPNPASSEVVVTHPPAKAGDRLTLYSIGGQQLLQQSPLQNNTQTRIDLHKLPKGSYVMVWNSIDGEIVTNKLMIQ
jgi:hypothetical protein